MGGVTKALAVSRCDNTHACASHKGRLTDRENIFNQQNKPNEIKLIQREIITANYVNATH